LEYGEDGTDLELFKGDLDTNFSRDDLFFYGLKPGEKKKRK
jgi:hypothetical protein